MRRQFKLTMIYILVNIETHEFAKKDGTSGCTIDVKGSIKFPSAQVQTDAWNTTNAGYSKSG